MCFQSLTRETPACNFPARLQLDGYFNFQSLQREKPGCNFTNPSTRP